MRVLVLEDDQNLLDAYTQALEDEGHIVHACLSEEAAMAQLLIDRAGVDVIILDLCLGAEMTLSFADFAGYAVPDAKVIVVTGSGLYPHGELQRLSSNIAWSLRKPVKMSDLLAMVHFVGHRQPNQSTEPLESKSLIGFPVNH